MEEILNIDYNINILMIKALNKAKTNTEAAILLGVEKHTIKTWIERFDIKYNTQTNTYYGKVIQGTRVSKKIR
jgi:transposase